MADGSVSIATLGIKVDASQPEQAATSLDKLTAAGAKAEASANKVSDANAKLAESARKASTDITGMLGSIDKSVNQLVGLSQAQLDAANAGAKAAQDMAAQQAKVLAAIEDTIAGVKEFAAGLIEGMTAELKAAEAASKLATATKTATVAVDDMADRVAKLRQAYDPLGVKLAQINAQMTEADNLKRAGAISADEHAKAISSLAAQYKALSQRSDENSHSLGLNNMQMLELTHSGRAMVEMLAAGISPLRALEVEAPRLAQALGSGQGGVAGGFKAAVEGIGNLISKIPPMALAAGAAAVAIGAIAVAAVKAGQELTELGNIAQGVGATAGLSAESLKKAYEDGAAAAHESTKAAKDQALQLADTGKIGADAIGKLIPLAKDYAELTGGDAKKATDLLGQAMSGNAKAIVEINDKLHIWNQSQQDHLVTLAQENDLTRLQAELLGQLPSAFDKAKPPLDTFTASVNTLADAWHAAMTAMKGALALDGLRGVPTGLVPPAPTPQQQARDAAAAANARSSLAGQYRVDVGGVGPAVDQARAQYTGAINAINARLADVGGPNAPSAAEVANLKNSLDAYTHARDTATTADAKAHAVALAQDQAARARTSTEKAAAASALVEAQALGEVVTKGTLAQRASDAARTAGDRKIGSGPQDQSKTVDDAAQKDYQAAQLSLTKDVQQQADIKHQQVAVELQAHEDMLARQVKEKSITASASSIADGYYKQAAALKDQLIDIERDHALAQQALQQRQEVGAYLDRQTAANENLAATADQATKLEQDSLARRQKLEADILDERLKYLVKLGQITQAAADEQTAALAAAQAAEKAALAEQERVRKINEQATFAEAPYQADQEILQAKQQLARSSYAQAVLNAKILADEQQIALIEAKKAVDDAKPGSAEQQAAQAHLDALQQVNAAQTALAQRETSLATGVQEAVSNVQSFSDAIKRHDWLSAFNDLMQTLETVSVLLGTDSGLGAFLAQVTGLNVGGLGGGVGSGGGILGSVFGGGSVFGNGGIFGGSSAGGGIFGGGPNANGTISLADQSFAQGIDFLGGVGPDSLGGKLDDVSSSIESMGAGIKSAISGTGTGTLASSLGSVFAGYAIGQTVGSPLAKALGINQGAGSQIGSGLGSIAGLVLGGPIGAAIGGVLGDLVGGLFDNKPTNGAGFAKITPDGFTLSSSSKTSQQGAQLAQAFAQAIVNSEGVLKAAGVTTKETVTGVDIGTRDKPMVTFSDGHQERLGNVGDAASAADAAMKEILQGATYVSDTEKKLVESMEAAGSSFDDIAKALQGYTAAQKLAASISDQLLQLTDPQAYDRKQVTDAIQAQRDSLKAAADAGYYTADQFAGLNDQLDKLQGLQLDEVTKKYADAANQAADQWKSVSQSLQDWLRSLTGQIATSAQTTAQAYAALQAAGVAARGGDLTAAGKITNLGDAYIAAAKASASSEFDYQQAVARARAVGSSVQLSAATHFATGGSFTVGGSGAGDSQNFGAVNLSPGEVVNVSRRETMSEVVAELKSVKAQLASQQADTRAGFTTLASKIGRVAKVVENWDGAGLPPSRDATEEAA